MSTDMIGWPTRDASPTSGDVLGLPAFSRGKNLIGGSISQMPLVDRKDDGTTWGVNAILDDPWPVMGRSEWISYQTDAIIMLGDAMAIPADFDFEGYPRQLVPIDPRAVQVYLSNGQVLHDLYTDLGVITLTRSQIWHAKGLTLTSDGLRGIGVVAQFRMALGLGQALLRYGVSAFSAGVPSGVIKINLRNVKQETADQVKADWMQMFRDRSPAVLSQLMDFTPISWSPLDAQFLENRRFNIAEIAYTLNLDPMDLDATAGSSMTYANREQRAYERLLTSIGPYLDRFQQAYRFLVPRGHFPTFDRSTMLWADSMTRAQVQQIQLATGVRTLNECRSQEQLPLYGAWADEPWAQPPSALPPPVPGASPAQLPSPQDAGASTSAEPAGSGAPPPAAPALTGGVGRTVAVPAHSRRPPVRSGGA
jgi:HK97 family phage portal protein